MMTLRLSVIMQRFSYVFLCVLLGCSGCSGYHGAVQCAPYARRLTGVNLHGSAASWWWQARGHYARVHRPAQGAVLVFRATSRMPDGHVAVVRRVLTERRITVDQANWVPGEIEHNVLVEDVSPKANWSRVRVWWSPTGHWGTRLYPTYGFLLTSR